MGHPYSRRSNSGAVMLQAAIGMPLFLIIILFLVWLGTTLNARVSLETSLRSALRLATTRGILASTDDIRMMPSLEELLTGATSGDSRRAEKLMNSTDSSFLQALSYVNATTVRPIFGSSASLENLPREYAYALVYLNQALKTSIGNANFKFPCNASDPTKSDPGCLQCVFLHPECMDLTEIADTSALCKTAGRTKRTPPPGIQWDADTFPRGQLAMRCFYRLPNSLWSPLIGLLNLMSPAAGKKLGIVTVEAVTPIDVSVSLFTPPIPTKSRKGAP